MITVPPGCAGATVPRSTTEPPSQRPAGNAVVTRGRTRRLTSACAAGWPAGSYATRYSVETDGATVKLNAPSPPAVVDPAGVQSAAPAGSASRESAAPGTGAAPLMVADPG